jgi:hypothetical protein
VRLKHSGEAGGDGRGLCPVGEHPAEVEDAEESQSKSGNDMLIVSYRVAGRWRVKEFVPLHVPFRVDRLVEAFGEVDSSELVGRTCTVRIEHESYEGRMRAVVAGLEACDESEDEGRRPSDRRAPDATRPAGRGLPPQTVPGTDDSDLPF